MQTVHERVSIDDDRESVSVVTAGLVNVREVRGAAHVVLITEDKPSRC